MSRRLAAVCLIAEDVPRLGRFYESLLETAGQNDGEFFQIRTGDVQLSICSVALMEGMAPGSTLNSGTGRVVLEFQVEDVDAEHARLSVLGVPVVKPPTTQPWGLRSVWFRDPEGNIVNLFAPVAG